MQAPATIFSQITATLYPAEFARCLHRFPPQRPTRGLTSYDHFLALCFGQLTYRESLRDIALCLKSQPARRYHLGFRGRLTRTNLAYASQHRDWRLFQAVAEVLMRRAARLYTPASADPDLPQLAFALDSSMIGLSLELFPWGYYSRSRKAALKLHLLLSLRGNVPAWGALTEAHFPDQKILDEIPVQAGACYIMDRGYVDFVRLHRIHEANGFFVVRCLRQVSYSRLASQPVDKAEGLRSDQTVRLKSQRSKQAFPELLRRVTVYNAEHKIALKLLTNNFAFSAAVIAQLYRRRWQVELFFKWLKQHLKIRSFYGRSENAVRCQIWSAISAYLMVAILKKELGIPQSLYEILQVLSVNAFEQIPAQELFRENALTSPASGLQMPLIINS
jgi:Transposase DDE domain/Domain of unknown function (DUF4372)